MAHRRPVSVGSLENSERDYENVIAPRMLRLQQLGADPTAKAKPDVPSPIVFTNNTGCNSWRASIVILYLLVCASLLIATAAFVLAFLKFIPHCPDGWQKFQTKCYYFSIHSHTWDGAMSVCHSLGAHLVVIDGDTTEQDFLDGKSNSSYWIGLRNYTKSGWRWVDGKPLSDNSSIKSINKNCMFIPREKGTRMRKTAACSQSFHYICEKQPA